MTGTGESFPVSAEISVSEMDDRGKAGTCMGSDHGTHGTDLDLCIRIDPQDLIAHFLCALLTDSMGNDHVAADRVVMGALIALDQIFDRPGNSALFGDIDQLSLVVDLEHGLKVEDIAGKFCIGCE